MNHTQALELIDLVNRYADDNKEAYERWKSTCQQSCNGDSI